MKDARWQALYVRSRFESTVTLHLRQLNIEHYLPIYRTSHQSPNPTLSLRIIDED